MAWMFPWNRKLFEEYRGFAMEKAKVVTNQPVQLVIRSEWVPTSKYGVVGGRCELTMAYWFGGRNARIENTYEIIIYQWFFDIFKKRPEIIKKMICHELAHIPNFIDSDSHSENFQTYAATIGATDGFNQAEINLLKGVNTRILRILIRLHLGCLVGVIWDVRTS